MADEFRMTLSILYENGVLSENWTPSTVTLPQGTQGIHSQTISHTTAEADVSVGSIGTQGYCFLQSLESTTTGGTLYWGLKSSTGGIPQYFKLPPKSMALVCYGTSAMVIRAKTASGALKSLIKTYEA